MAPPDVWRLHRDRVTRGHGVELAMLWVCEGLEPTAAGNGTFSPERCSSCTSLGVRQNEALVQFADNKLLSHLQSWYSLAFLL